MPRSATSTARSSPRRPSCAGSSTPRTTAAGVGKRSRAVLAPSSRACYTDEILDHGDLDGLVARLPSEGIAALLCVEREPRGLPPLADRGSTRRPSTAWRSSTSCPEPCVRVSADPSGANPVDFPSCS